MTTTNAGRVGAPSSFGPPWARWTFATVLGLTLLRLAVLKASPLDLLPDEAQYWSWSRDFAFGYFSKPPLIAWLIAATTKLAGDGEYGVRLASPLCHALAAIALYKAGAVLNDRRLGFWSALTYLTLPGVTFSATLISTDAPLLAAWAVALLAYLQAPKARGLGWSLVLGLAIGIGFLAKYAMAYFVVAAALHAIWSRDAQGFWLSRRGLIAIAVTLLCLAPNLVWNAANGWATFGHTAANAAWNDAATDTEGAPAWIGAQFGVFGPILMLALLWRLALLRRRPADQMERLLLCFTCTPLLIVLVQAIIARAHANWAAPAYVAGSVWVVRWLLAIGRVRIVGVSLALNLAVGLLFDAYAAGLAPTPLPKVLDAPFAFRRGWSSLAHDVRTRSLEMPDATILTVDRKTMAALTYYLRDFPAPLAIVPAGATPGNQFEMTNPVDRTTGAHGLLVLPYDGDSPVLQRFERAQLVGRLQMRVGTGRQRVYRFFDVSGFKG
jgi:4-amino-4-deoxy-L-arabinose transferase-like glycosyltransferase